MWASSRQYRISFIFFFPPTQYLDFKFQVLENAPHDEVHAEEASSRNFEKHNKIRWKKRLKMKPRWGGIISK